MQAVLTVGSGKGSLLGIPTYHTYLKLSILLVLKFVGLYEPLSNFTSYRLRVHKLELDLVAA